MIPSIPPPLPSRKPRRRLWLFVVAVPALVLALLLGWFINWHLDTRAAIRRLEASARSRGEPLTLPELASSYSPIAEQNNAAVPLRKIWESEAPDYWRAIDLNLRPLPPLPAPTYDPVLPILGRKMKRVPRSEPLSSNSLAAAESFLDSQNAHIQAVRKALQHSQARFAIRFEDGVGALLPHLAPLKRDAQFFTIEAAVAVERNQPNEAITALESVAAIGHILADDPWSIGQLVRIYCYSLALAETEHFLSRRALTSDQLRRLEELIHAMDASASLRRCLLGERCLALSFFNMSSENYEAVLREDQDGTSPPYEQVRQGLGFLKLVGIFEADHRFMLETMEAAIENADPTNPKSLTAYEKTFARLDAPPKWFPPRIMSQLLLSGYSRLGDRFGRFESRRNAALIALAVERYRLAHASQLPGQLTNLLPDYLPRIPDDPYDGHPMRYKRLSVGYVVYSIGADRKDDGGKENLNRSSEREFDETFFIER